MKKRGKIDNNQKVIVDVLRKVPGVTVKSTASLGDGFPDIIVGYREKNYLFEIKSGKGKLTPMELDFFAGWHGQVDVVTDVMQILDVIFS